MPFRCSMFIHVDFWWMFLMKWGMLYSFPAATKFRHLSSDLLSYDLKGSPTQGWLAKTISSKKLLSNTRKAQYYQHGFYKETKNKYMLEESVSIEFWRNYSLDISDIYFVRILNYNYKVYYYIRHDREIEICRLVIES